MTETREPGGQRSDAVIEYRADEDHMRELIDAWFSTEGKRTKWAGMLAPVLFVLGLIIGANALVEGQTVSVAFAGALVAYSAYVWWKIRRFRRNWLEVCRSMDGFGDLRRFVVNDGTIRQVEPELAEDATEQQIQITTTSRGFLLKFTAEFDGGNLPENFSGSQGLVYVAQRYIQPEMTPDEFVNLVESENGVDGTLR